MNEPDWKEVIGIYKDYRDDLPYLMHIAYIRGQADTAREEIQRTSEYLAFNGNKLLAEAGTLIDKVSELIATLDRNERKKGRR